MHVYSTDSTIVIATTAAIAVVATARTSRYFHFFIVNFPYDSIVF